MPAILTALLLLPLLPQSPQHQLFAFQGPVAQDLLGWSVAGVGDLDGDGVPDLAAGAPFAFPLGLQAGQVRTWSGRDGRLLWTSTGDANADQYGVSIDGGMDLDGDAVPDLVVGAWGHDTNGASSGQAKVLSGRNGQVLLTVLGDDAVDHFGGAVAWIGDVDGDQAPDFAAGAVFDDDGGQDSGSVKLVSGRTGQTLRLWVGDAPAAYFGSSVAAAGDVNGDGWPDVIAGAGYDSVAGPLAGMARVLSGRDGRVLWTWRGNAAGEQLGWAVANAGDVDRDGAPDLAVGVPGHAGTGAVQLRSGRSGGLLRVITGSASGDAFGWAVRSVGDTDGDLVPDLVIGAPFADTAGANAGRVQVISAATGSTLLTLSGDAPGDQFGGAVAGAGDLNLDGAPDILVGARFDDSAGLDAGLAGALSIRPLALASDRHQLSLATGGSQALSAAVGATHAGKTLAVIGSLTGISPGFVLGGLAIPLNPDSYTLLLVSSPGLLLSPPLLTLDDHGSGTGRFVLPPGLPAGFAGLRLDHAALVLDLAAGTFDRVTNPVPLVLTP